MVAAFVVIHSLIPHKELRSLLPVVPDVSVWHHPEGWNRLASRAGRDDRLCGLATTPIEPVFSGGYSYLHRDVPVFPIEVHELTQTGSVPDGANFLIADRRLSIPSDYRVVDTSREFVLATRDGPCGRPPPSYRRTVPRSEPDASGSARR